MTKMFDALRLSNNILKRAFDSGTPISPMKLQKSLYFLHCEYLARTGLPLVQEPFETWQYGPVVGGIYAEFKHFGASPIKAYAKDSAGKAYMVDESANPSLKAALDAVWPAVANRSGTALSRITHLPNSAWYQAWQNHERILSEDAIRTDSTYRAALGLTPGPRG